jgi:hypothetical protein
MSRNRGKARQGKTRQDKTGTYLGYISVKVFQRNVDFPEIVSTSCIVVVCLAVLSVTSIKIK